MSKFLLVHGAWHGAWCWSRLAKSLTLLGHDSVAVDLPGHGSDSTPLDELSLRRYRERVCETVCHQQEPILLVGHSMGGIVVSEVLEDIPNRIAHAVYLSAFLLRSGQSMWDLTGRASIWETRSELRPNSELCGALYSDCDEDTRKWALERLRPEPLKPLREPICTTEARFGRVRRTYIECLEDRVVRLPMQRLMQSAEPCHRTISLEAGHCPFLSIPDTLAANLHALALEAA